jgi:hypothetical protein
MGRLWDSRLLSCLLAAWSIGQYVSLVAGQFPPKPEGMKVVKSKFQDGITISYKEVSWDFN